MLRLYDNQLSGNGYKPRLLLAHLGQTYERIEVDILKGETRTSEFLSRNRNGRIPVQELEDGRCIAESNAILFFPNRRIPPTSCGANTRRGGSPGTSSERLQPASLS